MIWRYFNPNPMGHHIEDCAVRAVCAAFNVDWDEAFDLLAQNAKSMCLTMDKPAVMAATLRKAGFYRSAIPNSCPDCYTNADFCRDHPEGMFVLSCGSHIVTAIDGALYDSWDSSDEIPQYYYFRRN